MVSKNSPSNKFLHLSSCEVANQRGWFHPFCWSSKIFKNTRVDTDGASMCACVDIYMIVYIYMYIIKFLWISDISNGLNIVKGWVPFVHWRSLDVTDSHVFEFGNGMREGNFCGFLAANASVGYCTPPTPLTVDKQCICFLFMKGPC